MDAILVIAGTSGQVATSTNLSPLEFSYNEIADSLSEIRAVCYFDEAIYAFSSTGSRHSYSSGWADRGAFEHGARHAAGSADDMLVALEDGWMGGYRGGSGWYEWQHWKDGKEVYAVAGLLPDEVPADESETRWVAVGEDGRIDTADGTEVNPGWLHWTARISPFWGMPILAAARGYGLWVIAGAQGMLATSEDGIEWTLRDSGFAGQTIYGVAFDPALKWIAVGGGNTIATSLDGYTWAAKQPEAGECGPDSPLHRWFGAAPVNDCWVIVGDNNTMTTECRCTGSSEYRYEIRQVSLSIADLEGEPVVEGDPTSIVPGEVKTFPSCVGSPSALLALASISYDMDHSSVWKAAEEYVAMAVYDTQEQRFIQPGEFPDGITILAEFLPDNPDIIADFDHDVEEFWNTQGARFWHYPTTCHEHSVPCENEGYLYCPATFSGFDGVPQHMGTVTFTGTLSGEQMKPLQVEVRSWTS